MFDTCKVIAEIFSIVGFIPRSVCRVFPVRVRSGRVVHLAVLLDRVQVLV